MTTAKASGAARPSWPILGVMTLFLLLHSAPLQAAPASEEFSLDIHQRFPDQRPTILYDDQNVPFAFLGTEHRVYLPLSRIPRPLREAIIATEDARFYRHGALDLKGIGRALLRNLQAGRVVEGGSTITQQLAKILFLSPERTVGRKLREIEIAQELERRYKKDEILEAYLNVVYFGHGAYGVEAAAETYFGKSVGQLSLAEAATLAGLPRAPALYSPITHPDRALRRRAVVLERMVKAGYLTAARAKAAGREPLRAAPFVAQRSLAPNFVEVIRNRLERVLGAPAVVRGGYRVYTTLNRDTQRGAVEALTAGLKQIQGSRRRPSDAPLEAALVAMDPSSGDILAMVGASPQVRSDFNRATQMRRQPGSAFKPFVYAAAFNQGVAPFDRLEDFPVSYSTVINGRPAVWSPENFDHKFRGIVTVRQALEESINVPTVRLLEKIGVDPVIELAHRMGIESDLRREYVLALGASEVSPLEMVRAYGVFADGGIRREPRTLRWVLDPHGNLVDEFPEADEAQQVLSPEVAFLVTSVLEGAAERGTAKVARSLDRPVAAKTGTSQDATDLWFIGYVPQLVAGLWIGYDQPRSLGSHESAGRLAGPVWVDFMRRALAGTPPSPFRVPNGVVPLYVNRSTGEPTQPDAPNAILDFYISRPPAPLASPAAPPATAASGAGVPPPALAPMQPANADNH